MENIEYKGELFMDLKKIDDRREFLKRNLDTINTVVTAMIGVRTDLKVVEKTMRGETYFKLEDNKNYARFCGVMRHAWREVNIETFNIWWNEDGCELVLHFSYEHINGGHNGAEFGRIDVMEDFVTIK
jgi:hypothetical protein